MDRVTRTGAYEIGSNSVSARKMELHLHATRETDAVRRDPPSLDGTGWGRAQMIKG